METIQQTKVKDIKPLEVSDKQIDEFSGRVMKLYQEDKEVYEKASEIVRQIGYGGLWRGQEATLLIIADLIKN